MNELLAQFLALLGLLALGTLASARVRVPAPVLLAALGLAFASLPGTPRVELHPDLILVLFLPPLLYAAAFQTSWFDFRRWLRPILMLAVGLVALTIAVVGFVAHALLPAIPLAACMALGAIVSPTDTVAVQAVIERLHVPRRITAILGGESLVNDATGLVGVQVAVAVVASGAFSFGATALEFLRVAGLGVLSGLSVGGLFAWLNTRVHETKALFALSLLSPYLAYWTANALGASGVLAVIFAGFVVAWRIHELSGGARVGLYASWENLVFLLEGCCFLLIGLVTPGLLAGLGQHVDVLRAGLILSATVMLVRVAWCFPASYVPLFLAPRLRAHEGGYPHPRGVLIVSWAGVRGAVSLAAALALPAALENDLAFPGRQEIVVCTMIVVLTTLFVQGLTLLPLIRWLGIRDDDDSEHEVRRAREAGLVAGIARLDAFCSERSCPLAVFHLRTYLQDELATLRDADDEDRKKARARLSVSNEVRREVTLAQRARLLELRDGGKINDRTYTRLLLDLDRATLGAEAG